MGWMLGQVKLEDVLRSTQENMSQGPGGRTALALLLAAAALLLLLAVLQYRRKQAAIPRKVNHPGRLLKEVLKTVPLKPAEVKQLTKLAEEESCSSPLVLLLCPSLLARAMEKRTADQRRALSGIAKRIAK